MESTTGSLRFAGFGQVAHRLRATTSVSLHHHTAVGSGHSGTSIFTFVLAGSTVYTRTIDGTAFRPGLPFQVLLFVVYTPGITQNGGVGAVGTDQSPAALAIDGLVVAVSRGVDKSRTHRAASIHPPGGTGTVVLTPVLPNLPQLVGGTPVQTVGFWRWNAGGSRGRNGARTAVSTSFGAVFSCPCFIGGDTC